MRIIFVLFLSVALSSCANHTLEHKASFVDNNQQGFQSALNSKEQGFLPQHWQTQNKRTFVFFPKHTAWAVFNEQGNRVRTGKGSGGKLWCEDLKKPCTTVTGKFQIYAKKGASCQSGTYPLETNGGASMPYCQHFHQGYALHGSDFIPDYNASHGCIRVRHSAAKWLDSYLKIGSNVVVASY